MWFRNWRYKREVKQIVTSVVNDVVTGFQTIKKDNPTLSIKEVNYKVLDDLIKIKKTDNAKQIVGDCTESIQGVCYLLAFERNPIMNELLLFRHINIFKQIDQLLVAQGFESQTTDELRIVFRGLGMPPKVIDKGIELMAK